MSTTDEDLTDLPVARADARQPLDLVHTRMTDSVVVYHPMHVGTEGWWIQSSHAVPLDEVR